MASIRARLAFGYAAALAATLVVFAVLLWVARSASADQDLADAAVDDADHVLEIVHGYESQERPAVEFSPVNGRYVWKITQGMAIELDRHSGYFFLFGADGRTLYVSPPLRHLQASDTVSYNALHEEARVLDSEGQGIKMAIPDERTGIPRTMLFAMRLDTITGSQIARAVAGVSTATANVAPGLLAGTMLAILPAIVLLSLGLAYYIGGRALRPVEQLINEVEAISDGRSLHRRLGMSVEADELGRLTMTLNAMIARLEHSFGALRRFTGDASHELKTPLAVIRADVERAMHPATTPTERMVALEEALQEIARTTDLVDSLLTLARADEGRYDLAREAVQLEPLVREVFETATILGEAGGLAVTLGPVEDAQVQADPGRLRQLFLNLVTNAIKYTPSGGRVEVSLTRREPKEVVFSVRDTGIGIAAGDLPHIFDRFWRADPARSRTGDRPGTGLGLAITKWIAEAHGGTITVQSRPGRGSLFTVRIPKNSRPSH